MDLKSTYNKIAEEWVKDHDKDTWWQEGTDAFLSLLPKNSKILDVGCGGGIKSRYIANKGYQVTGIDFSEKMVGIAKRESPELNFKVIDIYELEKYETIFDGVFAQAVLLHIPKKEIMKVLVKMKDKLNPDGLLYIAVKSIKEDGLEENVVKEEDYGYEYERFFSYFNIDELKEYIKKLNMELIWEGKTNSGRAGWLQVIGRKV
jgi:SAM-dependent methyltransferase